MTDAQAYIIVAAVVAGFVLLLFRQVLDYRERRIGRRKAIYERGWGADEHFELAEIGPARMRGEPPGHYLTISYGGDKEVELGEFRKNLDDAFDLVSYLIAISRHREEEGGSGPAIKVYVHGSTYGSPLEIVLVIHATQMVIGSLVGAAVGINAAVQRIRRSISTTKTMRTEDEARQAINEAVRNMAGQRGLELLSWSGWRRSLKGSTASPIEKYRNPEH